VSPSRGWVARLRRLPGATRLGLLLRRVFRRIDGTEPRLAQVERAVADIHPATVDAGERLARIERHLPQLLNAISSFSGAARRLERQSRDTATRLGEVQEQVSDIWGREGDLAASITELWYRLETIRRELMYEVRYGEKKDLVREGFEPKVIDAQKVNDARASGLRVNIGCGHLPLDGYVNADMRELPGVDVLATADSMPFGEGELEELFSSHMVEHFPQEQLERKLLPYWISLLAPGGELRMVVPDAGAMAEGFAAGEIPWDDLRRVLYGDQEYEGDFHFNMYSTETLAALLSGAGLVDVEVEAAGRRNGLALEMQLVGHKPA
jgi:hypothetical protein